MVHFMLDGIKGFRARFDQVNLVQEILEEIPAQLGLQAASQAFLIPYYNGVVPEDCGISSFVFLEGGHFTLHTFSFRECYFADLMAPQAFDTENLISSLKSAFPCENVSTSFVSRDKTFADNNVDMAFDFGPHLILEIDGYTGPDTMGDIFNVFDRLPSMIGMTPIMRPYIIRGGIDDTGSITSIITMIAESHISLHVFHDERRAYFDLFSCSFFDAERIVPIICNNFAGVSMRKTLISRGKHYKTLRTQRKEELIKSRQWLKTNLSHN